MGSETRGIRRLGRAFFLKPLSDFWNGFERCLDAGAQGLVLVFVGLGAGWWLYVPLHELLHAGFCLLAGGSVEELEIARLYGGGLLAQVFPFVVAGSDYAGRLSGFDVAGSDLIYLATDLGPFLLTVFPGVWALRLAGAGGHGLGFGFWLPFAIAPFLSLTGDAYEIGSIAVTNLPWWGSEAAALRSDDLLRLVPELLARSDPPLGGAALAFLVGVLWAFATYWAGGWVAGRLQRPEVGER